MKKINRRQRKRDWNKKLALKKHQSNINFKSYKKRASKRYNKSFEELVSELKAFQNDNVKVTAPLYFSLIKNPEETIDFVNKIEQLYLNKQEVFVDLKNIKFLDHSAITILVSILFSFKSRNIGFNGNFPKNKDLSLLLINSDFFKYLQRVNIPEKLEYKIGKQNQLFTRANKEVNSELGLIVMAEASKTVWGEHRTCKGLQRTLLELMQNTNNHAELNEKGEKHWWLSVNQNKSEKKVSFIFVDYGIGIFESLKNKPETNKWFGWLDKIKNKLVVGGNEEIFKLLLNGEMHLTVTGQHFRGKGLPGIKEVLDRNQISSLKIISNNVFADVENDTFTKLKCEFSGTFVSWELNENNQNIKWVV
ncbi:hypothetical protein LUD75_11330 [Epilithonimonas sp. JDS]|uniref:hypothetical protein n=1 Tax=Epilithonimonas sp. JDS TaxID=2902797 RepID=UPI001E5A4BAC|nr:hypothetical protein [Epilithonimonas sp. JDS]MCD9855304.1 hypothetical protein [Epilithonimonas sp. JDS]